jgi:hypothetical protein
MDERMPTEAEWNEWMHHPCTKRLRFWADQARTSLMEQWADGNFSAAFDMEMAVKNAGATGACSIYAYVRELDYNQIVIGASDEEQVGIDPSGAGSTSGAV